MGPGRKFTEDEYASDPASVVAYASKHGRAEVVRADGSLRIIIGEIT